MRREKRERERKRRGKRGNDEGRRGRGKWVVEKWREKRRWKRRGRVSNSRREKYKKKRLY